MTHPIKSETADWLDEVFDGMAVDTETGEVSDLTYSSPPPEIAADLAGDIDAKIDGYAAALRRMDVNAAICAVEAERFKNRQRIIENRARRLREWIAYCMALAGRKKVATATTTATIVQNGGELPLDIFEPVEQLPEEFVKAEVIVRPDRLKIRKALESGADLSFARLMDRGSHLRIK
jgi:hypothetical protein